MIIIATLERSTFWSSSLPHTDVWRSSTLDSVTLNFRYSDKFYCLASEISEPKQCIQQGAAAGRPAHALSKLLIRYFNIECSTHSLKLADKISVSFALGSKLCFTLNINESNTAVNMKSQRNKLTMHVLNFFSECLPPTTFWKVVFLLILASSIQ